jgi:RNA polymerase sigma-70 factor (ECF subfamily)
MVPAPPAAHKRLNLAAASGDRGGVASIQRRRVGAVSDYVPDSFEAFLRIEYAAVLAFARATTLSWADAEDLTQEAFLAAFARWSDVGEYDAPGAFVRRVVANKSASGFRRRAREAAMLARTRRTEAIDTEGRDPAFWAAVAQLPVRQRHVIALFYLEDRSVAEIAEILGIADGTVKAHLHGGRQRLASLLGADLEEDR